MKIIHKVSYSDTLEKICDEYGCDRNELIKINELQSESLHGLPELIIPRSDTDFVVIRNLDKEIFFVVKKENMDNVQTLIDRRQVVAKSSQDVLEVGDKIILRSGSVKTHIVRPLETISQISQKYGVSSDYILLRNKLKTNKLFIGQKIIV